MLPTSKANGGPRRNPAYCTRGRVCGLGTVSKVRTTLDPTGSRSAAATGFSLSAIRSQCRLGQHGATAAQGFGSVSDVGLVEFLEGRFIDAVCSQCMTPGRHGPARV